VAAFKITSTNVTSGIMALDIRFMELINGSILNSSELYLQY
jgi:hypothetical protein